MYNILSELDEDDVSNTSTSCDSIGSAVSHAPPFALRAVPSMIDLDLAIKHLDRQSQVQRHVPLLLGAGYRYWGGAAMLTYCPSVVAVAGCRRGTTARDSAGGGVSLALIFFTIVH